MTGPSARAQVPGSRTGRGGGLGGGGSGGEDRGDVDGAPVAHLELAGHGELGAGVGRDDLQRRAGRARRLGPGGDVGIADVEVGGGPGAHAHVGPGEGGERIGAALHLVGGDGGAPGAEQLDARIAVEGAGGRGGVAQPQGHLVRSGRPLGPEHAQDVVGPGAAGHGGGGRGGGGGGGRVGRRARGGPRGGRGGGFVGRAAGQGHGRQHGRRRRRPPPGDAGAPCPQELKSSGRTVSRNCRNSPTSSSGWPTRCPRRRRWAGGCLRSP